LERFWLGDAIQILAGIGEHNLKIAGVRVEDWLIQTMIEHLVTHRRKPLPRFSMR
jgi:hypothetical protein